MGSVLALAFEGHPIRVTNETPRRVAVFDVLAVLGLANPRKRWAEIKNRHPEVVAGDYKFQFGGRGQRPTPVMGDKQLLKLLMVLEGPRAAAFREWASNILARYLRGDQTLAEEIHLRGELWGDQEDALSPLLLAAQLEAQAQELFNEKKTVLALEAHRLALKYRELSRDKSDKAEPLPRLLEGWEEISAGTPLSVGEALDRFRTFPTRYPRFGGLVSWLSGGNAPSSPAQLSAQLGHLLRSNLQTPFQGRWLDRIPGKKGSKRPTRWVIRAVSLRDGGRD